jgi:hypothetical protein
MSEGVSDCVCGHAPEEHRRAEMVELEAYLAERTDTIDSHCRRNTCTCPRYRPRPQEATR